jgi:hypothetical protein
MFVEFTETFLKNGGQPPPRPPVLNQNTKKVIEIIKITTEVLVY